MAITFEHFLKNFPEVELPVTLRDDSHHDFSRHNEPLSDVMIQQFIAHYEPSDPDDLTEYIACFQLPTENKNFRALIYWKAGLLNYDYVLATYDKKGIMIDKKAIAGTKVVGNAVKLIVAFIKEDLSIHLVEGLENQGEDYIADTSKARRFEILESGRIEQDY